MYIFGEVAAVLCRITFLQPLFYNDLKVIHVLSLEESTLLSFLHKAKVMLKGCIVSHTLAVASEMKDFEAAVSLLFLFVAFGI